MFRIVLTVLVCAILHNSSNQAKKKCCSNPKINFNVRANFLVNPFQPNRPALPDKPKPTINRIDKLKPIREETKDYVIKMFPFDYCKQMSALRWVETSFPINKEILSRAFKDFQLKNENFSSSAYVGRVYHEKNLIPGAIVPEKNTVYFPYKGKIRTESEKFEILTYQKVYLVKKNDLKSFDDALPIALNENNETVYVCYKDNKIGEVNANGKTCKLYSWIKSKRSISVETDFHILKHEL